MTNSKNISTLDRIEIVQNNSLLTELGVKTYKKSNAAFHLTPFLLKIFDIERSNLTDAISKSIVDLDDLAQHIDSKIDVKDTTLSKNLDFNKFTNLELRIVECFSHLTEAPQLEQLIIDTLECVNISFKYNTSERHNIYNLKNTQFKGCTIFYLFPLMRYLCSSSRFDVKNDTLFFLMANYIQILDDYIDLFDDISLQITTPLVVRLNEIDADNSNQNKSSFNILTDEVFEILDSYCNKIQFEAKKINKRLSAEVFSELKNFHSEIKKIKFPSTESEQDFKEFQAKILNKAPQIVCYS